MAVSEKFEPMNPAFRERVLKKAEGNVFMHHIDFHLTKVDPGEVEGELTLKNIHKQQFGRLHGGVVTSVADIVAGFAVYTLAGSDQDVVTAEIKVTYLRPGFGEKVVARGTVIKPGKLISFAEAEIFTLSDGKLTLIAKASTTMAMISAAQ